MPRSWANHDRPIGPIRLALTVLSMLLTGQLFTARLPVFPPLAVEVTCLMAGASGADRAEAALPLIEPANANGIEP